MRKVRRSRQKRANHVPLRKVPIQNRLNTAAYWQPLMYADCRDVARYVWVCGGRRSKLLLYTEELKSAEVPSPIRIH
jgi:hypothetical protein